MSKILIVDDDPNVSAMLTRIVRKAGHQAHCAYLLKEAITMASSSDFDVILLDVNLPDGSGLSALSKFAETRSRPEVIIITGKGDANGAELAIRSGAWDYIEKPASIESMRLPLMRALQYREEREARSDSSSVMSLKRTGIIGNSARLQSCFDQLARVAHTDASVLISGETGTGKELFAQAVHQNSLRKDRSFIVLDCSALPETLVESLLFGHVKGAFTSADKHQDGLVKAADGGTLFLDEVGELPLSTQKAFLRVIQEQRFRPVGGRLEITSDFRLVTATNRNLDQMVQERRFRKDLLFRLRSFTIELPPLRERSGDIKDLTMHHLAKVCERLKLGVKGVSPEFLEAMNCYSWPGNVRELLHAVERAAAAALYEPTLHVKHLPDEIRIALLKESLTENPRTKKSESQPPKWTEMPLDFRLYRENTDRQYFLNLMAYTQGSIAKACAISGLSRSRLYDLLKRHNIS